MKDRRSFYRNNQTLRFDRGETILYQDMAPKHLYGIKNGVVESYNITCCGESQTIAFTTVGGIFPKCWGISKTERTLFYYRAHTDCELYIISKHDFQRELVGDVDFSTKVINQMASSLVASRLHLDALGKCKASVRLLYTFRFLALIYGKNIGKNLVKIQIPLTQQSIANLAGLTRETTSMELNKIKDRGIASCKRMYYTIDTKKLNDSISDEYNPGICADLVTNVVSDREG